MRRLVREVEEMKENQPKLILCKGYYQVATTRKMWHREVYRKHWGKIPKGWVVHHIDCSPLNNDPENLIALPAGLHTDLHRRMRERNEILGRKEILELLEQIKRKDELIQRRLKKVRKEIKKLRSEENYLKKQLNRISV